ncbi:MULTISPECIES: DNA polymerase Y family protein [unclassified Crossiella]|uniref:DNA polymerase Y family protein n=1 Tax=unclassified Crossiella TaxID=2620835 RepID=UPI001FFE456F|nr:MULTISPECIES: DNA polymerase Y family protein [unclassified Crossiella]MCK2236991.1 DNA polymerase Y family protein [Crossiella sp. S99.2]MCK2250659.1 DNA polymerase Y family protein [Crossiella sp. S99.1]
MMAAEPGAGQSGRGGGSTVGAALSGPAFSEPALSESVLAEPAVSEPAFSGPALPESVPLAPEPFDRRGGCGLEAESPGSAPSEPGRPPRPTGGGTGLARYAGLAHRVPEAALPAIPAGYRPLRLLVLWCPDWPVTAAIAAAGLDPRTPCAVLAGGKVLACSVTARVEGIRRGLRRREAEGRCPELVVFEDDQTRDARLFEPVALGIEELAPGIEIVRPGLVALPAQGPVGYFGAAGAAERLVDQVGALAGVECQVGVADGLFAATLAAHRGVLVPAGGSPEFLAPLGIGELDQPAERLSGRGELVDLLRRLGLRSLGEFGALPEREVASRFGAGAVRAHRLARGLEERPADRRLPPAELAVAQVLDPPVERVDAAAFAARALAEQLHTLLTARGLACTRLGIQARTEHGEELSRVWRCAEPLTANGIADRVRWQLDGWLRAGGPTAGISLLRVEPEEVVDAGVLQLDLWKGEGAAQLAERAGRAFVRVQGMLGPDAVCTGVLGGGRGPGERVRLVPWGDEPRARHDPEPPWPGQLPAPSPTLVPEEPVAAIVRDRLGNLIGVSARQRISGVPYEVTVESGRSRLVTAWAGPWTVEERWWLPPEQGANRVARLQVLLADGQALLLACVNGSWQVEGVYD